MTYRDPRDDDPEFCDECGRRVRSSRCAGCDADYAQGRADAAAYHDALAVGGEDLAAKMELEAEYGYLG